MKTFEIADFHLDQREYISRIQDGNLWAEVRLVTQMGNAYLDETSSGKAKKGKLSERQQEHARVLRDELLQVTKDAIIAAGWELSDSLGFTSYKSPHRQPVLKPSTLKRPLPLRNAKQQDSVTPVKTLTPVQNGNALPQDRVPTPIQTALPGNDHVQDSVPISAEQEETSAANGERVKQHITVGSYTRTVATKLVTIKCARCGTTVTQQRYPSPQPLYCSKECKKEVAREQTKLRVQRLRASRKAATK